MNERDRELIQWGAANADLVAEMLAHLTDAWEAFIRDRRTEVPYIDGFMAAHNFHKLVVLDLIDRLKLEGPARSTFLKSARDTWVQAMNEAGALVLVGDEGGRDAGRST